MDAAIIGLILTSVVNLAIAIIAAVQNGRRTEKVDAPISEATADKERAEATKYLLDAMQQVMEEIRQERKDEREENRNNISVLTTRLDAQISKIAQLEGELVVANRTVEQLRQREAEQAKIIAGQQVEIGRLQSTLDALLAKKSQSTRGV